LQYNSAPLLVFGAEPDSDSVHLPDYPPSVNADSYSSEVRAYIEQANSGVRCQSSRAPSPRNEDAPGTPDGLLDDGAEKFRRDRDAGVVEREKLEREKQRAAMEAIEWGRVGERLKQSEVTKDALGGAEGITELWHLNPTNHF